MLRGILVGLDGTPDSDSAFELATRWAKRSDALLVGIGIVDEPGLHGAEEILGGEAYFRGINEELLIEMRKRVEQFLGRYAVRCAQAGVPFKELEDIGVPYLQILLQSQRYDLILLGQTTHFRYEYPDTNDGTLVRVLGRTSRPVVIAPRVLGSGETIVVAFDGSIQASRTLASFQATGLGRGRKVEILSAANNHLEAARLADRAVDYLGLHGIPAASAPVESDCPAEAILERARRPDVELLVMGVYGKSALHEFFVGSATRSLLREVPSPLFLFH